MLVIRHLTKRFGTTVAVDAMSMTVKPGEVLGLVGPNGAGKTTTLRILATLSKPDRGRVTLDGLDIVKDVAEVRRRVGFMPDVFRGAPGLLVWEYLDFFASAAGLRGAQRVRTVNEVLELTDMTGRRESVVQSLSRGMLQRLCLAKALLNNPALLLLDEPAQGLDPRARIELMALLRELHRMGKTILISSHILADLEEIADRIAIMEKGRLVACDTQEGLAQRVRRDRALTIRVKANAQEAVQKLRELPAVAETLVEGDTIHVTLRDDPEDPNLVLRAVIDAGAPVAAFEEKKPDLGEVFMRITKGDLG